jgi:AraC family transcriptional regulator, regulatory protein of adaptative response / DNA-3-methyladenine glycosylase II
MPNAHLPLDDDACYLALKSRDARFDGLFFTGVTSTGVYCRPVCRVKTPRQGNCRFFAHPAQAEGAGFRPCLLCRPELAPRAQALPWSKQDAAPVLAGEAANLLDELAHSAQATSGHAESGGEASAPVALVAARLGVSPRHLLRLMLSQYGVTPLQYLQTRRLLSAKALLCDTQLPMQAVALACGFGSLRRFNDSFVREYGMAPSRLRKVGVAGKPSGGDITLSLGFRPPYDWQALLAFWRERQLDTLEFIAISPDLARARGQKHSKQEAWSVCRSFSLVHQGQRLKGWLQASPDVQRQRLQVRVSDTLAPALPAITARLRAAFDLDADPAAIDAALGPAFAGGQGMRVPGSLDGFEIAVRAILGQQVTVAAGRTLVQRLLGAFGEPIQTPWPQVSRLFPTPQALAQASGDALGALGIVRQRQQALQALAQAVASGALNLNSSVRALQTVEQLKALPGIGDWTAQYIAMRALRWPDAFPAGDVALHHALGLREQPSAARRARAAEDLSQAWRPWRSYAVLRLWAGLYRPPV